MSTNSPIRSTTSVAALSAFFACACAALLTWALRKNLLKGTEGYQDFVAGFIANIDYFKSGELRAILFLTIASTVLCVGSAVAFRLVQTRTSIGARLQARNFPQSLPLPWAAVLVGVGAFCAEVIVRGPHHTAVSIVLLLVLPLVIAITTSRGVTTERAVSAFALLPLFACASTLALAVATPEFVQIVSGEMLLWIGAISMLVGALLLAAPPRVLRTTVIVLQVPIPLLFLRVLGTAYRNGTETVFLGMNPEALVVSGVAVAALIGLTSWQGLRKIRETDAPILAIPVAAIAMFSAYVVPHANALAGDDFHAGEMALPWQQIHELGLAPYEGFVSIQGTLGMLLGFVNATLFEGTLGTFAQAHGFTAGILASIIALLMVRVFGASWALLLAPVALPVSDRFWLVACTFLIVLDPWLLKRPLVWIAVVAISCWQALLWNPATGCAFTVALVPVGLWIAYEYVAPKNPAWKGRLSALVGMVALLSVSFFFLSPLRGVLEFVSENGVTSLVAHGTPWFELTHPGSPLYALFADAWWNRILFEAVRVGGWVFTVVALAALSFTALHDLRGEEKLRALLVGSAGAIFLVMMLPQSFGRIDPPPHLSRTGALAIFALTLLLPAAVIVRNGSLRKASPVVALFLGLLVGTGYPFHDLTTHSFTHRASPIVPLHPMTYVDGPSEGMPNLGQALISNERIAEVRATRAAILSTLKPGETYLDLTNRSIYHLILGLPVPVPYPYMQAVNRPIQERMIRSLEAAPPPSVWLLPNIQLDDMPPSIRTYRVFRWLMDRGYQFYGEGSFLFLLRPDRFAEMPNNREQASIDEIAKRVTRHDLQGLPSAWGRSFETLEKQVTQSPIIAAPTPWSTVNGEVWATEIALPAAFAGSDADYLLLDIAREGRKGRQMTFRLEWRGPGEEFDQSRSFTWFSNNTRFVIPVGSDPRWLSGKVEAFRLSSTGERSGARWRVAGLSALRLKK